MPTMWEYVLRADGDLDLANPANGEKWYYSQRSWNSLRQHELTSEQRAAQFSGAGRSWGEDSRRLWETNTRSFRHYAAKFKGAKTRKPGISPADAEKEFAKLVNQMRLSVDDNGVARIYGGIHTSVSVDLNELIKSVGPDWIATLGIVQFFQELFASMLTLEPRDEPICGRCGRPLERTKAGKPSRAELCGACKFAKWNASRPESERKERQNRAQQKHRATKGK